MAKTIEEVTFNGEKLKVVLDTYAMSGGTHVELKDKRNQPYCVISAPFDGLTQKLKKGEFYLKNWSENAPIAAALIKSGDIVPVPGYPEAPNGARVYRLKEV